MFPTRGFSWALVVSFLGALSLGWVALPVTSDPLVRMPGTQQDEGVDIEGPRRCLNCHDGYDAAVEVGSHWQGSMMAQAGRDPFFWAAVTVAAQDSVWRFGRPNAADLCLRCHAPSGWLAGRSEPPNGTALQGADFDGVHCEFCHRMYDPFFEDTHAGVRESNDREGYWDEGSLSDAAALAARAADRTESSAARLFNGSPFFEAWQPISGDWTENGGGQYFVAQQAQERASFADAVARHDMLYSRYHRSRYFCATCHDVSNPALANLAFDGTEPGPTAPLLPTEEASAFSYAHVERTFSEFALSDFGQPGGAHGRGAFAPAMFHTSRASNTIATCQDCHMADAVGAGCDKRDAPIRPDESDEHPSSGQPVHDHTGGNVAVPLLLASTQPESPNHDPVNASLLSQGPDVLTMDLTAGQGLNAEALIRAADRAYENLQRAAAITTINYDPSSGALSFRVRNDTGHKLLSGYPEGRRMFVNIRLYVAGALVFEINPYDSEVGTLRGLDLGYSPSSPPLDGAQQYVDDLVYEMHTTSAITLETQTFHFVLATGRHKDNRIPPMGFRIDDAAHRHVEPVEEGLVQRGYFTAAEYAGGFDQVDITVPPGGTGLEITLFYQTISREYVEFLAHEINATGPETLFHPPPSGEASSYIVQEDPFFAALSAWGDTIWQLWEHNLSVPGIAPIVMAREQWGDTSDPCDSSQDGAPCDDGNPCTRTDVCADGDCVGSNTVVCVALDDCHIEGSCNQNTGMCEHPRADPGTACDDGDPCTLPGACDASGFCVAMPYSCSANECEAFSDCDGTGGCSIIFEPAQTSCDDEDPCTEDDVCDGNGECNPGAYVCGGDGDADADADVGHDADPDSDVTDSGPDADIDSGDSDAEQQDGDTDDGDIGHDAGDADVARDGDTDGDADVARDGDTGGDADVARDGDTGDDADVARDGDTGGDADEPTLPDTDRQEPADADDDSTTHGNEQGSGCNCGAGLGTPSAWRLLWIAVFG